MKKGTLARTKRHVSIGNAAPTIAAALTLAESGRLHPVDALEQVVVIGQEDAGSLDFEGSFEVEPSPGNMGYAALASLLAFGGFKSPKPRRKAAESAVYIGPKGRVKVTLTRDGKEWVLSTPKKSGAWKRVGGTTRFGDLHARLDELCGFAWREE